MSKVEKKSNEEKAYSLKTTELNLIGNVNRRRDQALLDLFSYIAIERLNYPVTEQTQFRTDEEGTLYITELEPEPTEEVAVA